MEPGGPPIDSFKNPVEDLDLAKRLKAPAESRAQAALEREGLAWPNAKRQASRAASLARPRTIVLVAVLVIVFVVVLSVILGVL